MADVTEKLAEKIKKAVYTGQVDKVHGLKGKYVKRGNVTFYIVDVDWKRGKITASDVKTPLNQTTTFGIRAFLSKKVVPVEV